MLAWMLYAIMVSLLLSIGAFLAERAARLKRGGTRWIWISSIVASLLLPTLISSVSLQLPDVFGEEVTGKMVALREVTSKNLSPAIWISGSPQPASWRSADTTIKQLWVSASAAMLLALIVSGVHLFVRKRRWRRETVVGMSVYVTMDVGPAVVGLLRPRIAVPRWVTLALPVHQVAVIAHEQSHLEARDPQLFTLALALLVFMPWNLPLWWQLRRLRYAIEIDCDARVLKGGLDPTHYGETLIVVGERQSAYIGAVAAMSESKSFLEERIEHMIRKPVRWRRLGTATLASFAIAVTALAAQVGPPNAEAPTSVAAAPAKAERKEITLPAATLDRYVGNYRWDGSQVMSVTRNGSALKAQMTAQPAVDLYAESETAFFYKIVDAQIDFVGPPGAPASALVLHQGGADITMPRIDEGTAAQLKAELDARIASNTAQPGTEAALRKMAAALLAGKPDYEDMSPHIAAAVKQQQPMMEPAMKMLGALESVQFMRVGEGGWDVYRVKYANGTLLWRIGLDATGKISYALVLPDA
ncbi:MAG TPA: M56 family metallopeptidase [Steroidobacteraceae bacterium]|nr:M56 family metallopeptidase [Steroidobacteraceae bacterium]